MIFLAKALVTTRKTSGYFVAVLVWYSKVLEMARRAYARSWH